MAPKTDLRNRDRCRGLVVALVRLPNPIDIVDPGLDGMGSADRRPEVAASGAVVGGERYGLAGAERGGIGVRPGDRRGRAVDGKLDTEDCAGGGGGLAMVHDHAAEYHVR